MTWGLLLSPVRTVLPPLLAHKEEKQDMAILGREAINATSDLVSEDVPVEEWGGDVRLLTLTGSQRDEWEAGSVDFRGNGDPKPNLVNMRARLLVFCIVDENLKRVYSDFEVAELGSKSAAVISRLFTKAQEMNGLSDNDVKELTEDFGKGQSDSSTSA